MIIDHEYIIEVLMAEKIRLDRLRERLILAKVEVGHYDIAYHKINSLERAINEIKEDEAKEKESI